jgi:HD-GYP domain-containing protein (c-di-GMP phosphodiesterase class II)
MRPLLLPAAAAVAWLAFYASWLAVRPWGDGGITVFVNTAYLVPIAAAAGLALYARRRSPASLRLFWTLLAASNLLWLAAEIVWAVRELAFGSVPFPWWTDAGYLASFALMPVAVVAGFKPTLRAVGPGRLVEAALVVGGLALAWWSIVLRPLPLGLDAGSLVGLAYPSFGLLMIGMIAATRLLPSRRGNLALGLVAAGIVATALADGLYTHAAVTHDYLPGDWIGLGWQAEAVLFSLAAWFSARCAGVQPGWRRFREPRMRTGAVVAVALAALVATLAHAAASGRPSPAVTGAAAALAALLLVRVWLLLGPESREPSLIDSATGIFLEPYLGRQLRVLSARGEHFHEPFALALVGTRDDHSLVGAVREFDPVIRLGEQRFAVLLGGAGFEEALALGEAIRAVTIAPVGVASWSPGESPETLLVRAEEALAAAETLGGNQVRGHGETRGLDLLLDLAEQVDARENVGRFHARAVAQVARDVAVALGLDPLVVSRVYLAGLAHDVGKISIPDAVLRRPGPLTEREWEEMRKHPLRGERLVQLLAEEPTTAELVAAHHERMDGAGYPRRLAGDQIPLGARIVAAANALVSMTTDRPFRPAVSLTAALTEIWRDSGVRYDPAVVGALLELGRKGELSVTADEPAGRVTIQL